MLPSIEWERRSFAPDSLGLSLSVCYDVALAPASCNACLCLFPNPFTIWDIGSLIKKCLSAGRPVCDAAEPAAVIPIRGRITSILSCGLQYSQAGRKAALSNSRQRPYSKLPNLCTVPVPSQLGSSHNHAELVITWHRQPIDSENLDLQAPYPAPAD